MTDDDVAEIKKALLHQKYGDIPVLAKRYGVNTRVIAGIREGKTWKSIPWPESIKGKNGMSKLTKEEAIEIRESVISAGAFHTKQRGAEVSRLAALYGVDRHTIRRIANGEHWGLRPLPTSSITTSSRFLKRGPKESQLDRQGDSANEAQRNARIFR